MQKKWRTILNDFTLEDLLIIHLDMCTYVEQNKILKESPIHKELRLKIQSMIDNYCEHKHLEYLDKGNIYRCNECHMDML
jgi:hypothetical protein